MSNSDKYRKGDDDLISYVRSLERRISVLERTPRLSSSAIDEGGMLVTGGQVLLRRDPVGDEGAINHGSNVSVNGEIGMSTIVGRSSTVDSGFVDPDGATLVGETAIVFATVEGAITDPSFRFPTVTVNDKSGSPILQDTMNARRGMSAPTFNVTWFTAALYQTSTSTTFVDFAGSEWYFWHPHLRIRVLTQNDGTAPSEIQVFETDTSHVLALQSVPAGSAAFFDLIVNRSDCLNGKNSNGLNTRFSVQHRRPSGSGTIRTLIVEMLALDLSWFNPF